MHYNYNTKNLSANKPCYNQPMKIVFPEYHNEIIKTALAEYTERAQRTKPSSLDHKTLEPVDFVPANNLEEACSLIKSGAADSMIAGIDYSSRDVILACRDQLGMGNFASDLGLTNPEIALQDLGLPISTTPYTTFSGLAVMQKSDQIYLLADMAACKHPAAAQMAEIIQQTFATARHILDAEPKIALLSFSTAGSGGRDPSIDLWREVLAEFQSPTATIKIDGEMQLDAAINPTVGSKKFPNSAVAGHANVLIAPDLNSGNLLYKCFEQVAGFTVAGPILQGFNVPVSDLSRGSTVEDVILTIDIISRLIDKS